ncbi:MAG TPA: cyclic 2,3-diphosphoglycerate synthase [Longimicrobiales bacterium]|nr:cyclic 2,3-diphosphoglycerate synthase [Longimicrobiales bacterium]
MHRIRTLIIGAAGRDFHNFNMIYRGDQSHEVVGFTAQQIPNIADRRYPPELAGPLYPEGLPIHPEDDLERLIRELRVDVCVLSYSDLSYDTVGHLASRANAAGADFQLIGSRRTMLHSDLPVVAVCASRTGAGKSQTSRAVARVLRDAGLRVAVLRHPMPYGDLAAQRVQRFAGEQDLQHHDVTIEEREEYEPHIASGSVVWAGVDYEAILREAEREADVVLWDGGNNDTSFVEADVYITVVDPHRAGHELTYYPGETNVRLADIVIINKVDTASAESVALVRRNVEAVNPRATIHEAASPVGVDDPELLRGRRVLAVEDGPTLTHGGMAFGAACIAAQAAGATLVDPRPYAVGEVAAALAAYPHVSQALPAMGYGEQQLRDLEATIARAAPHIDAVAIGTPIDLARLIRLDVPATRVRYTLEMRDGSALDTMLAPVLERAASAAV